jgi:type I restriction enzyme, R subunit
MDELANAQVFRLPPFDAMGQIVGVMQRFGDVEGLRETLDEVQCRLYTGA